MKNFIHDFLDLVLDQKHGIAMRSLRKYKKQIFLTCFAVEHRLERIHNKQIRKSAHMET